MLELEQALLIVIHIIHFRLTSLPLAALRPRLLFLMCDPVIIIHQILQGLLIDASGKLTVLGI